MESDLTALLKAICPRVSPDVAPAGTATPYITYQGIGGQSMQYMDKTLPNKRNTLIQINVWGKTRAEALPLIRQAEQALVAATSFQASPVGEPLWTYDEEADLRGCLQTFSIWSDR
ncbi:DUF3168 domain-containing protein [uncultured Aquabacterium sp.]|uniref:DUF3168 domain-containing protein n=1 Tax=uncultured Aquabacterium sp. TaxID=158753 RepID=UPI0025E9BE96|nr:DUF3168 domain-containing protein [uncultured Aquabacterium sp.]